MFLDLLQYCCCHRQNPIVSPGLDACPSCNISRVQNHRKKNRDFSTGEESESRDTDNSTLYSNGTYTKEGFPDCKAGTVTTKSTLTARIGFHPTDFECTYTVDADENVHAGDISWQIENTTGSENFETLAEFSPPDAHGKHNQFASTATGSDFKFRSVLYDVVNSGVNTFTAVFRLNEIRCEDEGNYRCVVGFSTSSGSYTKSSNVSLMVTVPAEKPYRAPVPLPDVIEEGTKVQFSCTANVGKPPGNIKWWRFKPNKAVPDHLGELSTTPTMVEDVCVYNLTSSILAYTMSRNDDQSVFRCSVSNDLVKADKDYDNPHEDTKTIRVLYKVGSPIIEVTPNKTEFTAGSFVILSCNANGYPSPLIDNHINYLLWTFTPHGKSDDVILISNNGLLSLENLQHKDSGRYTCTAHNGFNGKTFSSSNHVDLSIHPGKTENQSNVC
uniref:Cell adhesion molecule 4 n=1 Tax=Magallana gigas TaxID=29159 RepID=K1Q3J6_MAGGI